MGGQGNGKEVKLLGTLFSPYVQRVVWVLNLKGIDYEWVEQGFRDSKNRSQLLLKKYNPMIKTVPVLVNHGRPVLESLIISLSKLMRLGRIALFCLRIHMREQWLGFGKISLTKRYKSLPFAFFLYFLIFDKFGNWVKVP
ncbi:hypothetical protein Golob_018578 [Gossypium lobatum]|uniref:GST N-terminal domain-containing protein n=1 Tax=Gossypium lobatum TaxID=34289 RepID=A0A7J8MAN8_9ROSI|nr:hypothetical protein [Gossypium lobatum]